MRRPFRVKSFFFFLPVSPADEHKDDNLSQYRPGGSARSRFEDLGQG